MAKSQKPIALYTVNGWTLELPGLVSPHFETLSGLSKKTGTMTIVDGGTNVKFKFSDQIKDFGQITLGRTDDGSIDDLTIRSLIEESIENGTKYTGALVKRHYGVEVFRIAFEGLGFVEQNWPDLDVNATEDSAKLKIDIVANVDTWLYI